MAGQTFDYELVRLAGPRFGLITLQADETIEADMRRLLPKSAELMVSRVPSDPQVSTASLAAMEAHLAAAAGLFPQSTRFDVVGYGCTSGTAQIGAETVAKNLRSATETGAVTEPLTSLVAACKALGLKRLALLSPYVQPVSERLQSALGKAGVQTPVFGSFDVATEATVARISPASIVGATRALVEDADVDAVFISCTNLRTLDVITPLEKELGLPVLSSNQVLGWHMMHCAGVRPCAGAPGRLFQR